MRELKTADLPIGIDIVPKRAASRSYRSLEQVADGLHKPCHDIGADATCRFQGMKPAREQKLVDVDVAKPGDKRLIEERRFEPAFCHPQSPVKHIRANRQRVITEFLPAPCDKPFHVFKTPDAAEAPRIMERHRAAVVEVPDDMRVFAIGWQGSRRLTRQRPGHAQVDAEHRRLLVVTDDRKLLATSINGRDRSPFEQRCPLRASRAGLGLVKLHHVFAPQLDAHDSSTDHMVHEGSPHPFDFWQFRHDGGLLVASIGSCNETKPSSMQRARAVVPLIT